MISIAGWVTNRIFQAMPGDEPGQSHDYAAERQRNETRKPPKKPAHVQIEEISLNGMPGEKLTREGNGKGWIFYIHGGGFTTGSALERRMVTQYLTDKCGYNCVAINYRLSPENRWPVQAEDCFEAYRNYLEEGYKAEDTVFMGESAGGTLVFSLAYLAKERGLPLPKAIVAFSPAVDNYSDLPSHTANISTDYMLRDAVAKGIKEPLFGGKAEQSELEDSLLSPINGDLAILPPVFLSASDAEVLYDDSVLMYEKLKSCGIKTELDIQHGVCHAFQMMTYMPEAKRSIRKMTAFLEGIGSEA